jgi:NADP-dependent 3-hydroxy acid dehydrogenase YdfG
MNNSKTQRLIVITGASAGLGGATAQAFARSEGARIGLIARGKEGWRVLNAMWNRSAAKR